MRHEDPRATDEVTGLPPIDHVDADFTMLVVSWATLEGVGMTPFDEEPVAVRYVTFRGLTRDGDDVEWSQHHIAVPVSMVMDLAAGLASGGLFDEPTQ